MYKFRNLPCTNRTWYVSGHISGFGSGVLEWCNSKEDAEAVMSRMEQDQGLSELSVECLAPAEDLEDIVEHLRFAGL